MNILLATSDHPPTSALWRQCGQTWIPDLQLLGELLDRFWSGPRGCKFNQKDHA